ncbi:nucleotidyltransferase domain-containing protein [Lactococcus ileimucosae]|uniref:Nucleotidyltransferase domain-containing protein n=1 Tax=Lactococcus ileimucosae TaxID=2941329 RepID=A0ABV4D537_9LACT
MILTIEEITKKVVPLAKKYNLKEVYLFGSYARGEAREDSDVDFIVDSSSIEDYDELFSLQEDLEDVLKTSVDIVEMEVLSNNKTSQREQFNRAVKEEMLEVVRFG